ncbi:hypothetical protein BDV23DRAFT_165496 [Aspergillus alliaceus]|uniref:Uncharacterized protein n=1 Tax=Petromyces alliaceus TaxID=209559 RepID=A0A5N7BTH4_PETAA|nr:hypothetical protein BDV23DRAFT_165496 [Aspergillus alliaceus]
MNRDSYQARAKLVLGASEKASEKWVRECVARGRILFKPLKDPSPTYTGLTPSLLLFFLFPVSWNPFCFSPFSC